MPDVNMPGGETFIRQIHYGKGYYREQLGVDVTNCWLIDTFGHHAQLPQLLRLAGYKSFWFSRGVPSRQHPSEFLWQGIDGTQIPAFWLPHSYGLMYSAPRDLPRLPAVCQRPLSSFWGDTRMRPIGSPCRASTFRCQKSTSRR